MSTTTFNSLCYGLRRDKISVDTNLFKSYNLLAGGAIPSIAEKNPLNLNKIILAEGSDDTTFASPFYARGGFL